MNTEQLERFDLEAPAFIFPAHIMRRAVGEVSAHSKAMQAARAVASNGYDLKDEDVFDWPALISNQQLDSWMTRMATSSLQNYAEDAKAGVAFMNSHKHYELPVGYSIDGTFEESGTPAEQYPRVLADFYTVRGLNVNGLDTDMFIKAMQTGLIRDVSIGFKEGEGFRYTCSVCGLDWFDWDCMHIPGVEYEVTDNPEADPSAQRTHTVLAFAWVENARLSEVSAVYDGATPDAGILKATRELRGGRLKPDVQRMLESKYRLHLPQTTKQFRGVQLNQSKEVNDIMAGENEKGTSGAPDNTHIVALAGYETNLRAFARGLNLEGVSINDATAPAVILDAVRAEIDRLRPLEAKAAEGAKLRKLLVDDAIKEGNRAFGDKFDAAAKTTMLESLDVDNVTTLRDSWKDIADAAFKGKTRASSDTPDEPQGDKDENGEGEGEGDTKGEPVVPAEAVGGV